MSKTSSSCGAMFQSPTSATSSPAPGVGRRRAAWPASRACSGSGGRRSCGRWARTATRCGRRPHVAPMALDSTPAGSPQDGLAVEADLDVLEADPAEHRHAVPLVEAGDRDLVAEGLQAHQRQLVLAGLGLLQGQHVDVVALEQRLDAVDPGAQRVDVPGGDPHPVTLVSRAATGVQPSHGTHAGPQGPHPVRPLGSRPWRSSASGSPPRPGRTPTPLGLYTGDETGFWFGLIIAWIGSLLLLVPVVAWGVRLGRDAWPASDGVTGAGGQVGRCGRTVSHLQESAPRRGTSYPGPWSPGVPGWRPRGAHLHRQRRGARPADGALLLPGPRSRRCCGCSWPPWSSTAPTGCWPAASGSRRCCPNFDGALLDNIVDYLTYVFAPMVLLWANGYLPDGAAGGVVAAIPLFASCYQFCRSRREDRRPLLPRLPVVLERRRVLRRRRRTSTVATITVVLLVLHGARLRADQVPLPLAHREALVPQHDAGDPLARGVGRHHRSCARRARGLVLPCRSGTSRTTWPVSLWLTFSPRRRTAASRSAAESAARPSNS